MNIELGSALSAVSSIASSIVKEGPVSLADLKNTMPLQIGAVSVEVIRFNSEPLVVPDVLAEAESILSQAPWSNLQWIGKIATSSLDKLETPRNDEMVDFGIKPWVISQVESMAAPVATPNTLEFPKPQTKAENALDTKAGSRQQIESLVQPRLEASEAKETVVSERVIRDEQIDVVEKKEVKRKKKFVVDNPTLIQRLREVGPAVQKAMCEAERLGYGKRIIGWILEKSLALVNPEDLSKVVRPEGPDGTLSIIRETIRAKNEFHSPEEVQAVVLGNRPVSIEEEGEPVSDEEVRKVFRDRIMKPDNKAMEIVERRTVKKFRNYLDNP